VPERVVAGVLPPHAALGGGGDERALRGGVVGVHEVLGHDRGDLARGQRVRERGDDLDGIRGGVAAVELRGEVGQDDVVGLQGLEAARLERDAVAGAGEDERRRRVAHAAVRVGRLALRVRRRALGRCACALVLRVGLEHGGVVEAPEQCRGVDLRHALEGRREQLGRVEREARREGLGLEGAEDGLLVLRGGAGGWPTMAGRPGPWRSLRRLGLRGERHPEAAESEIAWALPAGV
jgi:hypothetical protein